MVLQGVSFEVLWAKHREAIEAIARSVLKWHLNRDTFQRMRAAGQIALWEASKNYVEGKTTGAGDSFWLYARRRVRGAMLDELRVWDHLPREGRAKVRSEKLEGLSWALIYPRGLTPARGIAVDDNPEENALEAEKVDKVREAMETLSPQEKLIAQRTLIEQKTLAEVGKELKLSEGRICQIRKEAILKMRDYVNASGKFGERQ